MKEAREVFEKEMENHEKFVSSMLASHERFGQFYQEELNMWRFNSKMCKYRIPDKEHPKCLFPNGEMVECCAMNCPLSPLPK